MKSSVAIWFSCVLIVSCLCCVATGQETATLRMKFAVDGSVPEPKSISNVNDAYCAENPLVSNKLLVGKQGELQNFAVILDEEKSKLKIPAELLKAPAATHVLDNVKCMFEPKIIVARSGQTISVKNSDNTGHNANFNFLKNPPTNFLVPAGQSKDLSLKPDLVEPTAIPIECNVHPWMKAFVIVKQHPFVGVSNADGVVEISNLPAGSGAVFRLWHEAAGAIDQVEVNGKSQKLSRGNRLELELKPGVNDLGVIKLNAKLLKAD